MVFSDVHHVLIFLVFSEYRSNTCHLWLNMFVVSIDLSCPLFVVLLYVLVLVGMFM